MTQHHVEQDKHKHCDLEFEFDLHVFEGKENSSSSQGRVVVVVVVVGQQEEQQEEQHDGLAYRSVHAAVLGLVFDFGFFRTKTWKEAMARTF